MNERRLAMMQLFDSRKKFTARELSERFNVSIRTIQRDLDYLQQMGFPLYTEVGAHGGYRVLPNRILPPLQLTQHEAFGLFMMIQYLEKVTDFPYGSVRAHLAEHYFAGLPADVQETIERMRNHITFIHHDSKRPAKFTTMLLQAAVEKKGIRFLYKAQNGMKEIEAHPVGIYYEHYWYMPAKRHDRVLLYRVDRIEQLEILDQTDTTLPTLKQFLNSDDDREGVEVRLQFTGFGSRLAETDGLLQAVQYNEWKGRVPLEELSFFARRLLKFGPEVKVLAPQTLQELIVEMLEKSLKQYT